MAATNGKMVLKRRWTSISKHATVDLAGPERFRLVEMVRKTVADRSAGQSLPPRRIATDRRSDPRLTKTPSGKAILLCPSRTLSSEFNMQTTTRIHRLFSFGLIVAGTALVAFNPSLATAQESNAKTATEKPQVNVNVLRQDEYEAKVDGEKTTVTMLEVILDPLAGSLPHRHPGPLSGYVLEGTFEFQVEGGPLKTLKAGDAFFESKMILHKVGRNPDKEKRTRVLATIVHPSDAKSLVIVEPDIATTLKAHHGGKSPETCAVPTAQSSLATPQTTPTNLADAAKPKPLTPDLPVIGLLIYDHVLQTEITAPSDVFSKHSEDGMQMFNVITIAASYELIETEEGLKLFPDYTFENAPKLDVIVVPSAYDMSARVKDERLVHFIQSQNENTQYTVSNCGGASLIGEAGIAKGKKIVTWIGGGADLQKSYPQLKVQDDAKVSFVEDGKFLSSNGNLASYISRSELSSSTSIIFAIY